MSPFQILILSIIQGACELLPVSSSAHVIVAAKLMSIDPSSPEMTLLLVMLHTGTMFAVLLYFWNSWRSSFFASSKTFWNFIQFITAATAITGLLGGLFILLIEKVVMRGLPHAEIELLFSNLGLIAGALAIVGGFIIYAGCRESRVTHSSTLQLKESCWIGAVQALCLPFRGFSRSGATISTGLCLGLSKKTAEEFSFALAVVLTPPVIVREVLRLMKAHAISVSHPTGMASLLLPSLLGMIFSFLAGFLALKWLSNWLEKGRWKVFGYYCLAAALALFLLHQMGY